MKDLIKDNKVYRICYACRKEMELNSDNFYRNKSKQGGFELCCKSCSKNRLSQYKKKKTEQDKKDYNNYRNEWRRLQHEKGLCKVCKEPHIPNSKVCEKHYFQELSRKHLGTTVRWEELKRLLQSQNYTCIYSGEKLVLGENASVDHIKPLSEYPELNYDIKNLQWVTKQINLMKLNMSEDIFLKIIKSINVHKNL